MRSPMTFSRSTRRKALPGLEVEAVPSQHERGSSAQALRARLERSPPESTTCGCPLLVALIKAKARWEELIR